MSAAVATTERVCVGCGGSIDHLRPQATTCSAACRQAKHRRRARPLAPGPISRPTCAHPATLPDEDGDPVCIFCGTLVGTPSRPNGHEVTLGHMVTDADGQYRRLHRKPRVHPLDLRPRPRGPSHRFPPGGGVVVIGSLAKFRSKCRRCGGAIEVRDAIVLLDGEWVHEHHLHEERNR